MSETDAALAAILEADPFHSGLKEHGENQGSAGFKYEALSDEEIEEAKDRLGDKVRNA